MKANMSVGTPRYVRSLLSFFGGCSHSRTTFPLTPARKGFKGHTYVCCLECGREFEYDWNTLQVGAEIQRAVFRAKQLRPVGAAEVGPAGGVER